MYSIYKKMIRKKVPVRQVYDARALRVIVGDEGGSKTEDAWAAAYRFVACLAKCNHHKCFDNLFNQSLIQSFVHPLLV